MFKNVSTVSTVLGIHLGVWKRASADTWAPAHTGVFIDTGACIGLKPRSISC